MPADQIEPLEDAYLRMREATKPNAPIPDRRGPLVYDLTETPSLNGVDPYFKDLEGGAKNP